MLLGFEHPHLIIEMLRSGPGGELTDLESSSLGCHQGLQFPYTAKLF